MKACSRTDERLHAAKDRREPLEPETIAHLESCDSCRAAWLSGALIAQSETSDAGGGPKELAQVPEFLERQAVRMGSRESRPAAPLLRRWLFATAAGIGLALVASGSLWMMYDSRPTPPPTRVLRGAGPAAPLPLGPRDVIGSGSALRFEWTPPAGAAEIEYRLVVVDLRSGETVLEVRTSATSYEPSETEKSRLDPGVRYHWLVEPITAEGGTPSQTSVFWLEP